ATQCSCGSLLETFSEWVPVPELDEDDDDVDDNALLEEAGDQLLTRWHRKVQASAWDIFHHNIRRILDGSSSDDFPPGKEPAGWEITTDLGELGVELTHPLPHDPALEVFTSVSDLSGEDQTAVKRFLELSAV
ncbi:MAG TPA: hypothetical protein VK054_10370, partial [Beutenbergiaceae bacterium]|nr:hypothetical protein [Beutenbergiaceae bacterium]